jgi:hypothetical protein
MLYRLYVTKDRSLVQDISFRRINMLFDRSISIFESEKERNLYYKVFAGYLLNEFIPGYQD